MRIGILTYHYVYNEGAIWQAYALCTYLRSSYPQASFEIIDYRYEKREPFTGGKRNQDVIPSEVEGSEDAW